jgi:hypothetical protein
MEQTESAASRLYNAPQLKALKFTGQSANDLADTLETNLYRNRLLGRDDPEAKAAYVVVDRLREIAKQPEITLADINGLKEKLKATAEKGYIGSIEGRSTIRNFLDNLTPSQVTAGDPMRAIPLLQNANKMWAAQAKAFEVPAMLRDVKQYAEKNQISIDRALAERARGLTPEEMATAKGLIQGDIPTRMIRLLGSFDPTKNPLAAVTHAASAFATQGATAPLSGVAGAAGRLGDYISRAGTSELRQDILNRSPLASVPGWQATYPWFPAAGPQTPRLTFGVIPKAVIGGVQGAATGTLPYWLQP